MARWSWPRGSSQRMQGIDKTFAPIWGKPLILHTLSVFLNCPAIQKIVLVMPESNLEKGRRLIEEYVGPSRVTLCAGGDRTTGLRRQGPRRPRPVRPRSRP